MTETLRRNVLMPRHAPKTSTALTEIRARRWVPALIAGMVCVGLAAGCTPVGVAVGAGATAATAAQQEKGFTQAVTDVGIQAEINNALFQADHVLFGRVNLSVTEARVLLTGRVPTPEDRVEATRLTWQVQGVQEVINELQVDDSSSIVDAARDQLIAATLRQKLIFDSAVRSINYSIATVNGRIYLFGIARSADELDRVVNHGRNVKYVRDVTSYVRIAEPRT